VEVGGCYGATIRFGDQVGRDGKRVELKTEESKATLPLYRAHFRDRRRELLCARMEHGWKHRET
jgi:hypothetical protein